MDYRRLRLMPDSAYSESVNPGMRNEFSTAAFRFGHTTVQASR